MKSASTKAITNNKGAILGAAFLMATFDIRKLNCFVIILFYFFTISFSVNAQETIQNPNSLPADTSQELISKKDKLKGFVPDTVFLKNGDKLTGKILSFEQGRLSIDGQGPGVVSIKWHKIISISGGNRRFKVEDVYGVIYIGRITFSSDVGAIDINGDLRYEVKLENIIRIFPLEAEWYRGLKGDLGAGLNYAKSSEVLTINADYNIYYVISKWRFVNNFSYISTATKSDPASIRLQVALQALYALPHKWVVSELNSFNRNDELGIKARFSFAGGIGNNIVQTETQRLLLMTGIVQNLERDIESNTVSSNLELPFTIQHTIYSFIKPNISSTTSASAFIGITEPGRYRVDASTDITWEFITNLKLKLTVYYNYDNKSLDGKETTTDYGTVLSLVLQLK